MSQPTDRPAVPRYWVLGDLKRDNAIGGYPEGWHNVVTACDYDALDAERQRLEKQIVDLTIDKTNLAFGLNQALIERDEALAKLELANQSKLCAETYLPTIAEIVGFKGRDPIQERSYSPLTSGWCENLCLMLKGVMAKLAQAGQERDTFRSTMNDSVRRA